MKFWKSILIISTLFAALSCENDLPPIPKSDYLSLPTASAEDFLTVMADSGWLLVIMSAPLMEQWDNTEEPYTEFREGIRVDYYDGDTIPHGSVTAKYAKFDKNTETWIARDSVVVINSEEDKLETELLNWDQKKDLIYTDRFVKITRPRTEEIIQGFGFESDSHLRRQKIKKVNAIITIETEE